MFGILRKAIKDSLHAVGLELRRIDPVEVNQFVWLKEQNIRSILDIGANVGQFALMIHPILPNAMIYSFEPIKDCYEQLIINMKDISNFKAFNFAIGHENSETKIWRNEFSPSSSLLPMRNLHKLAFPYTKREKLERITVKSLDEIANDLKLEDNVLVKIDVQGYEDKVINGGHNVISKAKILIVETSFQSLYDGQPLFATIFDMLRRMGFRYCGNFDQLRNPADGSILQADSIFVKKDG